MSYLRCDIFSQSLEMMTSFAAILPDEGSLADCSVVYLLHGLSDNCTAWSRFTSIERYAREKGAAVIMPEVQRSFYTDMAHGLRYFNYISEELPKICARMFGLSRAREKNYIMGLSMGGYGAMKCALTAPAQYAGCASFSAVTEIERRVAGCEGACGNEFRAIFGPELHVPESAKLSALLDVADAGSLPRFFVTCGEQDGLFAENCRHAAALADKGCGVTFRHWPGDHEWSFWDASVEMALDELI